MRIKTSDFICMYNLVCFEGEGGAGGGSEGGGQGDQGSLLNSGVPPANAQTAQLPADFDYRTYLPQDLASDPSIKDIKSLEDLGRSFVNAQKTIGMKGAIVPSDPNDVEGWKAFNKAIGVPEAADGYKFPEVQLPEGMQMDEGMQNWFKEAAVAAGIPQRSAEILFAKYAERMIGQFQDAGKFVEQRREIATKQLNERWGQDFTARLAGAQRVVRSFGSPELAEYLETTGLGNDPMLIGFLGDLSTKFGNDVLVEGTRANGYGDTPAMAQAKIREKHADEAFMKDYLDDTRPGHKGAVEEMERLFALANP